MEIVHLHSNAIRVGNSWAILIPKENAQMLHLNQKPVLCVDISIVPRLHELVGTYKTKKSTEKLIREIDSGWE
jgi:antitoxin component of MazEF toxin-antitoxin module